MTRVGGSNIIQQIGTIHNERGEGTDVIRWHPDSRHIAVTGTETKYIYVWDIQEKKLVKKLDKKEKSFLTQLTYSHDGKYLICRDSTKGALNERGRKAGGYALWTVADNYRLLDDSRSVDEPPRFNVFRYLFPAPDGRVYSYESGGARNKNPKLFFYEVPSMERQDFRQSMDGPDTIAFSNDGRYMAEGYKTHKKTWDDVKFHLRMWKYPEMELLWDNKEAHHGTVKSIAFSPDSKFLVTGPYASDEKTLKISGSPDRIDPAYLEPLKLWETQTGKFIRDIIPLTSTPIRLHFLDEKHILGVTAIKREIIIWDLLTGKELDTFSIPRDPYVFTAELSPDEKTLAFGKKDTILLFEFRFPPENKTEKAKVQEKMP
ncbi:MAG: hypothetical protein ACD_75C00331G0010 [uncultured bacterium]|nr:MAG: hypothetical protein ACD_75C00331G0010 [uncultured bacterium]